MWTDIKRLHADAGAFARALPILFLIPALVEFAQHVVEIDIGMYRRGMAGVANDPSRLAFGFAKTLALMLPGYWFVRYMAWNRDAARARRIEQPAAGLFGIQFVIRAAAQWLMLFGPPLGALLGLAGRPATVASAGLAIGLSIVGVYLTAWFVAWPLGNARIGPVRSFAVMKGVFWRAFGYMLAGFLPLTIVHYALGYGAIGRPEWLVWAMMVIDALVVGFLALTMAGAGYLGAEAGSRRNAVPLAP